VFTPGSPERFWKPVPQIWYIVLPWRVPHNGFPVGGGLGGQARLRAIARIELVPLSLVASVLNLRRPFQSSGQAPGGPAFGPLGWKIRSRT